MPTLAPDIRKRLEDSGTFDQFCFDRTQAIKDGETPKEAFRIALKKNLKGNKPVEDESRGKTSDERAASAAFRQATREESRVPKSVFKGKECSYREEVEWVAKNIEIRGVKPADAPSSSAWGLLRFARSSPTNLMYFWKDFYAKLNTVQAAEEEEGHFTDDGREILDTIQKLKRGQTRGAKGEQSPDKPPV